MSETKSGSLPSSREAKLRGLTVAPLGADPRPAGLIAKNAPTHVPHDAAWAVFVPEATDPEAAVTVNGEAVRNGQPSKPVALNVGRNFVQVEVTSADGKSRNGYSIRVMRSYPTPAWTRVAASCPWAPRDSAGELVFNGRMWLLGGYLPEVVGDVWSSADGADWTRVGAIPCSHGVNIPVNFVYDGKMWVACNAGEFFSSSDGATWTLVTENTPWAGRYATGGAVFNGRMWAMGGRLKGGDIYNDIWSSADGANWTMESAAAPWSRRQLFSMLTVHDGRMWILGGGITNYHPFRAYNDVWSSADGKTWAKVCDETPWPARTWSSAVEYRNRLWVLTGFRAEPTWNNFNDVWYSADGARWDQLVSDPIWTPRHEVSVYVFDGRLWVVAGNSWPLTNDVWRLDIPGLSFLTQPVIEDFAGAQYTYRCRADFNEGRGIVRYRLVESPRWMTIDGATGLIRGTPDAAGDVTVTIEAGDNAGETARQCYTLHVLKA